jgi:hypothetical protein
VRPIPVTTIVVGAIVVLALNAVRGRAPRERARGNGEGPR